MFVYLRVLFWEFPHFFKAPSYISEVFYVAWYAENRKKSLYCMEISLPIDFPGRRNLFQKTYQFKRTTRQCLYIFDLSERIFENFPNSCFITSHLLWQVSHDTLQSSKFFEAKAVFLRHFKIHQIYLCQWFSKNHIPLFNSIC